MSIPATQLRPGMIIKHNNDLHSVFSVEHRTPGNLRAFIQAKLRNLRTGAMFEHRFRSPDPIEKVNVDEENMEFLYSDGDDYYFMNTENYEQTHLTRDTLGDAVDYLTPNLQIKVEFSDGRPGSLRRIPGSTPASGPRGSRSLHRRRDRYRRLRFPWSVMSQCVIIGQGELDMSVDDRRPDIAGPCRQVSWPQASRFSHKYNIAAGRFQAWAAECQGAACARSM